MMIYIGPGDFMDTLYGIGKEWTERLKSSHWDEDGVRRLIPLLYKEKGFKCPEGIKISSSPVKCKNFIDIVKKRESISREIILFNELEISYRQKNDDIECSYLSDGNKILTLGKDLVKSFRPGPNYESNRFETYRTYLFEITMQLLFKFNRMKYDPCSISPYAAAWQKIDRMIPWSLYPTTNRELGINLCEIDGTLCLIDYFYRNMSIPPYLKILLDISKCGCLEIHAYENICIAVRSPIRFKVDESGEQHCEDGSSIEYLDGYKKFFWHDINVPGRLIEDPESFTLAEVLSIDNQE